MKRILLLIVGKRNREQLEQWLANQYELVVADHPPDADQPFGVILVDFVALQRHRNWIKSRRAMENPAISPVLLITSRYRMVRLDDDLFSLIDDLIVTPLDPAELKARLNHMVQLHRYSLELKHNHETLTRIQTAVESTGDAISIADPDGVAIYQNRAFSNLYGFTLEELNVRGIPDTLFADPAVAADVFNSVKRGEAWSGEVELRRKAGQVMPALLRADNITDENDVSIGIVAVYTDINRIRQVEASERQQRILAEALQKTISTITGTLELDEVLDLILEYTRQVVPHDAVNIMLIEGNNATVVRSQGYKPQDRQNPLEGWQVSITESAYLRNMLETGETIIIADVDLVSQNDVIQQSQLHAYLGAPILFRSRTIGFINVNSEKPNFFTQYHAERLAIFSQFVGTAIENAQLFAQAQQLAVIKERHRMAQNLHDAVSQTLFSASGIAEALPRIWRKNPEAVLPRLQQLERMTRGALAEMRTLLYELRPAAIHEVDLKHLLTQLAEGAMGRSTVDVRIISDWQPATEIPDVVQENLYHITQEGLNNVVKHAHATQAEISLHLDSNDIQLTIRDDGCGFDPEQRSNTSLGLNIMQERATAIGASLRLESRIGQGTTVTVVWPNSMKGTHP